MSAQVAFGDLDNELVNTRKVSSGFRRINWRGDRREVRANVCRSTQGTHRAESGVARSPWSLKAGDQVFFTVPRAAVLRTFAVSHIVHHRAQLIVYLRLLDVPVPGLYGPSADEQ